MDTAGKNTKAIKEYIKNQLKQDRKSDQLSLFDPRGPFKGYQVTNAWLSGWQRSHLWLASSIRAMPEKEIPPAMRVDLCIIVKSGAFVHKFHKNS